MLASIFSSPPSLSEGAMNSVASVETSSEMALASLIVARRMSTLFSVGYLQPGPAGGMLHERICLRIGRVKDFSYSFAACSPACVVLEAFQLARRTGPYQLGTMVRCKLTSSGKRIAPSFGDKSRYTLKLPNSSQIRLWQSSLHRWIPSVRN